MAGRGRAHPKLAVVGEASKAAPHRRNRVNLFELAYERIEDLIINCELRPGRFLSIQDLQDITGFSRTPVHQAVSRLADDTLILVRPRHGVQIAPIDLARERVLLHLRRDLERFVVRLATERSGPSHRNQFLHLERLLRARRENMTIGEFNVLDRRIDKLVLAAAAERFLEHTLRPLHTIFRRIGWIHHNHGAREASVHTTIDCHLAVLDAIANRHVDRAVAASDKLIDFVESMFDIIEREIDPALLDSSLEPLTIPER
jgi:DNA-binding GntR family transcriptional regulator